MDVVPVNRRMCVVHHWIDLRLLIYHLHGNVLKTKQEKKSISDSLNIYIQRLEVDSMQVIVDIRM